MVEHGVSGRVAWDEYQDKLKELSDPLHRLAWCVDLAQMDWEKASAGGKLDIAAGLLVMLPEFACWEEDEDGLQWGRVFSDEYVLGFQERLLPIFLAIAEGSENVELTTFPIRLRWYPVLIAPEANMFLPTRVAPPQVLVPRMSPRVIREHEHGLNGVELLLFSVSMLLFQLPDSLQSCPARRTNRMKHARPVCGNVFVALHASRRFCSQRCAVRSSHDNARQAQSG